MSQIKPFLSKVASVKSFCHSDEKNLLIQLITEVFGSIELKLSGVLTFIPANNYKVSCKFTYGGPSKTHSVKDAIN